jgi:hypothetical protein
MLLCDVIQQAASILVDVQRVTAVSFLLLLGILAGRLLSKKPVIYRCVWEAIHAICVDVISLELINPLTIAIVNVL